MSDSPRCPRCGSKDTSTSVDYKIKKGLGYAAEFGIGYIAGRFLGETGVDLVEDVSIAEGVVKEWQCNSCGHKWSGNAQNTSSNHPSTTQLGSAKPQNTKVYNPPTKPMKQYNKQDKTKLLEIIYKCDGRGGGWNSDNAFILNHEHLYEELQKCSINISKSKINSVNTYRRLAEIILDRGWTYTAYLESSQQPIELHKSSNQEDGVYVNIPRESAGKVSTQNDINNDNKQNEQEYLEELKECLADGELGGSERRLLNKLRMKLGISEERATELEASVQKPQLTEEEQEYLEAYQDALEDGVVSEKERRLLDKLMKMNNISEERTKEIEKLNM